MTMIQWVEMFDSPKLFLTVSTKQSKAMQKKWAVMKIGILSVAVSQTWLLLSLLGGPAIGTFTSSCNNLLRLDILNALSGWTTGNNPFSVTVGRYEYINENNAKRVAGSLSVDYVSLPLVHIAISVVKLPVWSSSYCVMLMSDVLDLTAK